MRGRSPIWIMLLMFMLTSHMATAGEDVTIPPFVPGEVLIKLMAPPAKLQTDPVISSSYRSIGRLNQQFRVTAMKQVLVPRTSSGAGSLVRELAQELSKIYLLRFEADQQVMEVVRAYQADPHVVWAQPNFLNRLCVVPNDSLYHQQWALSKMHMSAAWDIQQGSSDIVIGVVDSGIDYHHEDLAQNVWINAGEDLNGNGLVDSTDFNGQDDDNNGYIDDIRGWDFTDAPQFAGLGDYLERDNDPDDDLGHGTHVSGIIAAVANNDVGVAGMCWQAKIMPLRASFRISVGAFLADDDVSAGIVYAADNGARVINMSWGDPRISPVVQDVVAYAYARGCVLVAAAGNVDQEGLFYPGGYDQTIAVGASDSYDQRASFSSFGKNLDVLAPGSNIMSTFPGDTYGTQGGTSMAAPHVSGLAALILSQDPDLTAEEVRGILTASAKDLGPSGWDAQTGNGRIDGLAALRMDRATRVQIHSPQTGSGVDDRMAIVGTAVGLSLKNFSLSYGLGLSPSEYHDILGPIAQQAWEETLMVWDGPAGLPDTVCTIRLQVQQLDGRVAEDRVVVHVDHTPPILDDVQLVRRLDGQGYAVFAQWRTDDESLPQVFYRRIGEGPFSSLSGIHWSTQHSLDLTPELEPGEYQLYMANTNAAGLRTVADNDGQYYSIQAPFEQVERGGFLLLDELSLGYQFHRATDLDQDGRRELLFMAFSDTSTYGPAVAYEMNDEGFLEKAFQSQAHYLIWDVDDADGDGRMEILAGGYAEIYLFESPDDTSFPDPLNPVWTEQGIWGSQFADMDRDGLREIVSKVEVGSDVVVLENDGDNHFSRVNNLPNPTEGRNSTGTRFAIADFDGDGRTEILAGDDDGDIYIYESTGDDDYQNTWMESTGLEDARYLAAGDSLENGGVWFAVAANRTDVYDPRSTYWRVTVYQPVADNQFSPLWSREIVGVSGQGNGLVAADFTGDGKKELILCALPDLYVFGSAEVGFFRPLWYTPCGFMYRPFVGDLQGDGFVELAFNGPDSMVILEPADAGGAPPPPSGIVARPLGRDRIFLEWMAVPQARSYNLHRGLDYYELIRVETGLTDIAYLDSGLVEDQRYYYAVTSVDSTGMESHFYSTVVWATPNAPPRMESVEVLTPRHLAVFFDQPMGTSAQVASHYQIEDGIGTPSSVILDRGDLRALLTLKVALEPETFYTIQATNVSDASGVLLSTEGDSIRFAAPADTLMKPLFLRRADVSNGSGLDVLFSEVVDSSSAQEADHYVLEPSGVVQRAWVDSILGELVHLEITDLHSVGGIYTLTVRGVWNRDWDRTMVPGWADAVSFTLPAKDLSNVSVVPSPFLPGRDEVLQFLNLPAGTSVYVFTLSGELTWEGRADEGGNILWAGENHSGQALASGVYLYLLKSGGEVKRGKLVLIR